MIKLHKFVFVFTDGTTTEFSFPSFDEARYWSSYFYSDRELRMIYPRDPRMGE